MHKPGHKQIFLYCLENEYRLPFSYSLREYGDKTNGNSDPQLRECVSSCLCCLSVSPLDASPSEKGKASRLIGSR